MKLDAGFGSRRFERSKSVADDKALLAGISRRDPVAFWQFWQFHEQELRLRCLQWMRGNLQDAEDILGSAMIKLWDELPKHASGIENPRAWLTQMIHNICVDALRRRDRRSELAAAIDPGHPSEGLLAARPRRPDENLQQLELRADIHRAVRELPVSLRQAFELRFFEDMAYPEIAKRLRTSPLNVRKRIERARLHLRSRLDGLSSRAVTNGAPQSSIRRNRVKSKPTVAKEERAMAQYEGERRSINPKFCILRQASLADVQETRSEARLRESTQSLLKDQAVVSALEGMVKAARAGSLEADLAGIQAVAW